MFLTTAGATSLIALLGIVVFATGLANPFQGDDTEQITGNPVVHSLAHIVTFFQSGTFYTGHAMALYGPWYRPLETTIYSLVYVLFGPHPIYFHVLQLIIYIAADILLYLFLRYAMGPTLSLIVSLIFLVHPLNSQVVFAIPSMADVLFFFFGVLALWLLTRFQSKTSLLLVVTSLLLALLSKETAIVFVVLALLYLWLFNRERLLAFIGALSLPLAVYIALRTHAVGLATNPISAPIDNLSLLGRLLTAPSLVLFYLSKFIFPWKLATGYYWVYPTFSIYHVLLPAVVDLALLGIMGYGAFIIHRRGSQVAYRYYLFFAAWTILGILPYLQIVPLDFTACESWFYCSMAGLLGMVGAVLHSYRVQSKWLVIIAACVIAVLAFRTAMRGLDWKDPSSLADMDITNSPQDYIAASAVASQAYGERSYYLAQYWATQSVQVFPNSAAYTTLANSLSLEGEPVAAAKALRQGILDEDNLVCHFSPNECQGIARQERLLRLATRAPGVYLK